MVHVQRKFIKEVKAFTATNRVVGSYYSCFNVNYTVVILVRNGVRKSEVVFNLTIRKVIDDSEVYIHRRKKYDV